ncbi:MAG: hypothetical protein GXP62_10490, partial [Oligoflexia bacterium]|nr:hypothetical protein [Oligoflexia bacterium]
WPLSRLADLLHQACDDRWLLRVGDGPTCVLGERGEAAWHRGEGHTNLGLRRTIAVVDSVTGQTVGQVAQNSVGSVSLDGRGRRVLLTDTDRVVTESGQGGGLATFGGGSAPAMHAALARALLFRVGLKPPCRARLAGGETIFHGLGTAGGLLLAKVIQGPKRKVRHAGPLAVVLDAAPYADATDSQAAQRWPVPARVQVVLDLHHAGLARKLGLGALHGSLPEAEQRRAVQDHCGASLVEACLAAGLPPLVEGGECALWDAAAWT